MHQLLVSGLKMSMQWLNKTNIDSRYEVCHLKARMRRSYSAFISHDLIMTIIRAQYSSPAVGVGNMEV